MQSRWATKNECWIPAYLNNVAFDIYLVHNEHFLNFLFFICIFHIFKYEFMNRKISIFLLGSQSVKNRVASEFKSFFNEKNPCTCNYVTKAKQTILENIL